MAGRANLRLWQSTPPRGDGPPGDELLTLREGPKQRVLRRLGITPYGGSALFRATCEDVPRSLFPVFEILLGVNKRGIHFFDATGTQYWHSVQLDEVVTCRVEARTQLWLQVSVSRFNDTFLFSCTRAGEVVTLIDAYKGRAEAKMRRKISKGRAAAYTIGWRNSAKSTSFTNGQDRPWGTAATEREVHPYAEARQIHKTLSSPVRSSPASQQSTPLCASYQPREDCASSSAGTTPQRERTEHEPRIKRIVEAQQRLSARHREEWQASVMRSQTVAYELLEEVRNVNAGGRSERFPPEIVAKLEASVAQTEAEFLETRSSKSTESDAMRMGERGQPSPTVLAAAGNRAGEGTEEAAALKAAERRTEELKSALTEAEAKVSALTAEKATLAEAAAAAQAECDASKAELESLRLQWGHRWQTAKEAETRAETLLAEVATLRQLYRDENLLRRQFSNQIEEMKGKVRVLVRIRPGKDTPAAIGKEDELTVAYKRAEEGELRRLTFDGVLGAKVDQTGVYARVAPLVQGALDGYNCCLVAYGQTGAGKTHSLFGTENQPGVAPRAIEQLFGEAAGQGGSTTYRFRVTILEIYGNSLVDLLRAGPTDAPAPRLEVKKDPEGLVWVQGAVMLEVGSASELQGAVAAGMRRRRVAETALNRDSSRSHVVLSVVAEGANKHTGVHTRGKLTLVDLAGSERVKRSGAAGQQLKEAAAINQSLSALGDVVSALISGAPHVPYNNHKLTKLLSDGLGGNAKTIMLVCLSPEPADLPESHNSLQYAARVRKVQNGARLGSSSREVARLREQVEYWREQAGLPQALRESWDLREVTDERESA